MNKKTFSALFMVGATIFNFIVTAAIIAGLFLLFAFLQFRVLKAEDNSMLFMALTTISFIGGIILGLIVYTKTLPWVILHFNLTDKLDERLLGRYLPNGKKNPYYKAAKTKKTATKLPQSVLPKEEDLDEWEKEVENSNPYLTSFEVKSFGREELERRAQEEQDLKEDTNSASAEE